MWERCRPPMAIVIIGIKGDKEGQTSGWNKSGLNNKCKSISWLSDCYHLFKDKGSPSFGACAPPSPNLTFSTYALLRRVGRLFAFRFTCFTTESVPTWRTLCKFLLDLGEMPQPWLIVIPIRSKRSEVSPLGGVYLSFGLNWEECRCRETLLSFEIQNGKEGLPQIWNKSGLNNKSKSISWLSNILALIYNLLAPLFRRIRATFPQFNFLCLYFLRRVGRLSDL